MSVVAEEVEAVGLMGGRECFEEQPPEQAGEHGHRQEEAGLAAYPARAVKRYPATRHNHVDVGVMAPTPTIP